MKLKELMGSDAKAAREALKLVELSTQSSEMDEMLDILETQDHVELIKGLCFVVCLVSSFLCGGVSPAPIFEAIRKSTEDAADQGHDVETNFKVLDLLDATTGHGGSFYLQAYALKEPFNEILGLATLFHSIVTNSLGKDVEEVAGYLNQYIDDTF